MATIHVDGKSYEVDGSENLLQACLSLGIDIPYFCWHPSLGSVGSCRQCAVTQYANPEDTRGRLVMSCMTPAADNTYISIEDKEAVDFRESVIEFLMTNHPHDCPVCEEGGHCHLQDMTVMTGHDRRRYRFTKRTHYNQELGSFIAHEMNRCIACYRCVRYYNDYAGGTDLGVYANASRVYFGRPESGALESEFSGNLTEICPTGVFTDKTHSERYNRKWDMQYAPSVCQGCSSGCNISPGERYGELRRVENRFNGEVNQYFLCDKGRFGTGYVNRADRPRQPQFRSGTTVTTATVDEALDQTIAKLKGKKVLGIGSPRASLESNFALRELVGQENYSTGMNQKEQSLVELAAAIMQTEGIYNPSMREIESYDAVLILGEDLTQTAPRMALSVRQAAKNKAKEMAAERRTQEWLAEPVKRIAQDAKSPIYILAATQTRLADVATGEVVASPNDIARLGFAVAQAVAGETITGLDDSASAFAQTIADTLKAAKKPLIISGTSLQDAAIMEAAAQVAQNLGGHAGLSLTVPEVNSMGLALFGGLSLEQAFAQDYDAVIVVENDLYRRLPATRIDAALAKAAEVIVLDHSDTATVAQASIVLSAASFAEGDGTVVSQEGRAQRYYQVYDPSYYNPAYAIKESWRWLHALQTGLEDKNISWTVLDDVIESVAKNVPVLEAIQDVAPDAGYRIHGLKIAREPRRYSGRTAMRAPLSVHEPKQPTDIDSALTFSMEGYVGPQKASSLVPFAWAAGWNSPQAWNKYQDEVGGHLKGGDSGVRLFDRLAKRPARSYVAPAAVLANAESFRLVPMHHIFASGEFTVKTPAMETRIPEAMFAVGEQDASRLNVQDGQRMTVKTGDTTISLPVQVIEYLPTGYIGYPVGLAPTVSLAEPVSVAVGV
ncbi:MULTISPECIES: NADH-quinone oxidoreductase subunit NuoG [Acinetobacter]|jgi:NADH-quinone oxidoreductase subunit G|uniref:NADH-quinone oxidoreductase n=1 Tax=Acinetobacter radioresistens TaxID=40216 RepID=A0A8H2K0E3_ACIRA|nr:MULTISPECIES: NADH-quinone oxidoreductase subunit NuoG [Acinetobacter]ENV85963.1 NADH dehydrogenase (quinone), G subunit [Acinetobacter radioresistens DSM 6976 = NBRC 102413 = CIP 103788]EXB33194.1 NADH dehydrogenase (quinone), G subunit [Acinetobacter sp. 1461402]EXB71779.1 NADH dehydrogenase (quinone), G subunit [Acinetobacter sp. 230853]EXC33876.1 NADH dehydrogenase (quinone), G subunit [Acinetobacter sp. 869535]EXE15390.1 NADH dehydrogenase (quinone), G subunit [Acinetobacter sp. 983759